MRKILVNTFLTLDGVMQAPGGPGEDPTGGFTQEGWSAGYWDELMGKVMEEIMGKPFDLLLGRKTYEIFAANWPQMEAEPGPEQSAAVLLNNARKYVASRTLKEVTWKNSTLLKGDVVAAVRRLKQEEGPELQVHGSSNLLQTLIQNNLIDEYSLFIFPVIIGSGKRLFGPGTVPAGLKLLDSKTSTTGVLIGRYAPAGEIKKGLLGPSTPSEAELARREKVLREG